MASQRRTSISSLTASSRACCSQPCAWTFEHTGLAYTSERITKLHQPLHTLTQLGAKSSTCSPSMLRARDSATYACRVTTRAQAWATRTESDHIHCFKPLNLHHVRLQSLLQALTFELQKPRMTTNTRSGFVHARFLMNTEAAQHNGSQVSRKQCGVRAGPCLSFSKHAAQRHARQVQRQPLALVDLQNNLVSVTQSKRFYAQRAR